MANEDISLEIEPDIDETKNTFFSIFQIIRIFSNACDQKKLNEIKKLGRSYQKQLDGELINKINEDVLSTMEKRIKFKSDIIDKLLERTYNACQDDDNLLFFASATFNLTRLKTVLDKLKTNPDNLNQTRYLDSCIIFVLKYANLKNDKFIDCIEMLIANGVDVNLFDFKGKTAFDYVCAFFNIYKHDQVLLEKLRKTVKLILHASIIEPDKHSKELLQKEFAVDLEKYKFKAIDQKLLPFYFIITNKTKEFLALKNISQNVNLSNLENTLLQLATKKNMIKVAECLLKNGADPNLTTKLNPYSPLELAGRQNNQKIFEEILKNKKTNITKEQFNNFIKWRLGKMKARLFELLLESDKLDPQLTFEKNGNTPLHYAVLFSHKNAIQNILKQEPSLNKKNNCDVSVLDIIDAEDLNRYFDSCLVLDNYTSYFSDVSYKMKFRFKCLIDESSRETKIVAKIGHTAKLEHLLIHPFVHTFINLKWFRIQAYFWFVLLFQALLFTLLSICSYDLSSNVVFTCCIFLTVFNMVIKAPIFLFFRIKNKRPKLYALNRAKIHSISELFLIVTSFGGLYEHQLRAFVFIEMAIAFLLTAGYHPKLSKWSLMLQQVFTSFTILLLFFSLFIVAFSVGFKILFPSDLFFHNFFSGIFRTFIMTTGEFNIGEETNFDFSGFSGYLLYFLFAMSVSLVLVNFWTGVAVTDIERIEKKSEINASKNVIMFMLFIDYISTVKIFKQIMENIRNPLLFSKQKSGKNYQKPYDCYSVDFFPNKTTQFENRNFPPNLDSDCFNKIKSHYDKHKNLSHENEVLAKLDELTKMVNEIKSKITQNQNLGKHIRNQNN